MQPEAAEYRSATGTVLQAMESTGILAGGLGGLAAGAAKAKEVFGGKQGSEQSSSPTGEKLPGKQPE